MSDEFDGKGEERRRFGKFLSLLFLLLNRFGTILLKGDLLWIYFG